MCSTKGDLDTYDKLHKVSKAWWHLMSCRKTESKAKWARICLDNWDAIRPILVELADSTNNELTSVSGKADGSTPADAGKEKESK